VALRWPTARTFRRGEAETHLRAVLPRCGAATKAIGGEQCFESSGGLPRVHMQNFPQHNFFESLALLTLVI